MTNPQRKLAAWQAFLTFYVTVCAGSALTDVVGLRVAGIMTLIAAALQGATATYLAAIRPPETIPGSRDAAA